MNLPHRKWTSHRDTYSTPVIAMVSWVMWLLVTLTVHLYQSTALLYPILPDHVTHQVLTMRADEINLTHWFLLRISWLADGVISSPEGKIIPNFLFHYPLYIYVYLIAIALVLC